jgi:uncharacterized membrane protein YciS (DUF1049 family)
MKLNLQPDRRLLRQFAWAALVMFPLIAGFLAWRHDLPLTWVLVLCGIGVVVALVELVIVPAIGDAAGALLEKLIPQSVYRLLTLVAFPIGFVLSHVLIAIIYYLVITPIALLFRVMGRDVIGKKLDPGAPTYWHDRGSPRPASSYFKLY